MIREAIEKGKQLNKLSTRENPSLTELEIKFYD